ncbi:hypothetical protein [Streptomyces sp. NPDC002067]
MGIESDQLVFDYLSRVGDLAQQRGLPSSVRMRLVADLRTEATARIAGQKSPSVSQVKRVLSRLGTPEAVVSAAEADAGTDSRRTRAAERPGPEAGRSPTGPEAPVPDRPSAPAVPPGPLVPPGPADPAPASPPGVPPVPPTGATGPAAPLGASEPPASSGLPGKRASSGAPADPPVPSHPASPDGAEGGTRTSGAAPSGTPSGPDGTGEGTGSASATSRGVRGWLGGPAALGGLAGRTGAQGEDGARGGLGRPVPLGKSGPAGAPGKVPPPRDGARAGQWSGLFKKGARGAASGEPADAAGPRFTLPPGGAAPPHLAGADELGDGDADWWLPRPEPTGVGETVPGFVGGIEIPEIWKRPGEQDDAEKAADAADGTPGEGAGEEAGGRPLPGLLRRALGRKKAAPAPETPAPEPAAEEAPARARVRLSPVVTLAVVLLLAGAVLGSWLALAAGWAVTFLSRRLTTAEAKFAALGVPGVLAGGAAVWMWGRATGRWGDPIASGKMGAALLDGLPVLARVAAVASAVFLVWRMRRWAR